MMHLAALPGRGVIAVEGEGRVSFLQGLVSNDVTQAQPGRAVWAAFLTPQGKYLADFFIIAEGDRLLLDCEAGQVQMLITRLSRFRLREKVKLTPAPELSVHAAWGSPAPTQGLVAADPRLPEAGWRVISDEPLPATATEDQWQQHRLALGLPDGTRDMEPEKSVLLEGGFDELNGISWQKGCYLGQELTARTKYRGLVKRRLVPVWVEGSLPAPGTPVFHGAQEVGTMRSGLGHSGLAVLRLGSLSERLTCGNAVLTPRIPNWMRIADSAS
jgi:folate-binding protein YgfZ